jgi:hypothetical protein
MSSGFRGLRSPGNWGYVLQRLLKPFRIWKDREISVNFQLPPSIVERGDRPKDEIRVSGQLAISKERSGMAIQI